MLVSQCALALTCYFGTTPSVGSRFYQFQPFSSPLSTSPCKPIFKFCNSGSRFIFPTKASPVNVEKQEEEETVDLAKLRVLKQKIECVGISWDFLTPGHYNHVICPKCKGGQSMESSLSFHINQNKDFAMWRCFRIECGWAGQVFADIRAAHNGVNQISKVNSSKQLVKERLRLEPLSEELIAYFAKRMISEEVLKKNAVMQTSIDKLIAYFAERMISKEVLKKNAVMQTSADKNVIAFTYRRNGEVVNCKYRSITNKRFWQEKGAEKILYGVDDIKEAGEIIIVEGEIDKLSMEQAGLLNCVSVPDGAPQKVSDKELPPIEKDTRFQYLWNCKQYLDKAPRIILATDSDMPGQVLAEELARRLGRDRCWLVSWPRKDEFSCFKDANEVLKNLGSVALRDIIDNAQPYQEQNLN